MIKFVAPLVLASLLLLIVGGCSSNPTKPSPSDILPFLKSETPVIDNSDSNVSREVYFVNENYLTLAGKIKAELDARSIVYKYEEAVSEEASTILIIFESSYRGQYLLISIIDGESEIVDRKAGKWVDFFSPTKRRGSTSTLAIGGAE